MGGWCLFCNRYHELVDRYRVSILKMILDQRFYPTDDQRSVALSYNYLNHFPWFWLFTKFTRCVQCNTVDAKNGAGTDFPSGTS
jgi:hypothetical protein